MFMSQNSKMTDAILNPDVSGGAGKKATKKRGSSFQTVSALFRVTKHTLHL